MKIKNIIFTAAVSLMLTGCGLGLRVGLLAEAEGKIEEKIKDKG